MKQTSRISGVKVMQVHPIFTVISAIILVRKKRQLSVLLEKFRFPERFINFEIC